MSNSLIPFLVISGPPGVGKTTVAWEVFDQLVARGSKHALVDLDLLGASWPVPADDEHNERLKARNLAAMWQNFRAAGAERLIAAGVIENAAGLSAYVDAVPGLRPTVCRLRAADDTVRERIVRRGREFDEAQVEKLARRARELSAALEHDGVADLVIDTDQLDVPAVAQLILSHLAWGSR